MQTFTRSLAASLAFTAISFTSTVNAQQSTVAVVEEIIVTANRRQEMLQDVPLSIAAFNDSFFEDAGVTDFKTLENYAASLKITPGTSSRETSIRIRGIGSTGANSGIDPSVGVFIDNVYQGRAGMSLSDFIDIERVEVLRGPQGTLYGKNTAAGAISVITKAPTSEFEATVEAVLGNYDTQELRGMVNLPLNKTGSAVRIAAYNVDRAGFDENTLDGKDINDADKSGIKFKTLLELDKLGSLTVTVDRSREDSTCCAPDIISYGGSSNLNLTFAQLAAVSTPLPEADPFDREVEADAPYKNDVDVGGISVEWSKYLDSDFILTWTNAYRSYESQTEFDADFSRYDGGIGSTNVDYSQRSSEFRIASPEGETIDYQIGLYYFESDMDTEQVITMEAGARDAAVATGNIISGFYDFGTGDPVLASGVPFGPTLIPLGSLTGVIPLAAVVDPSTLPPPFFDPITGRIIATDNNNHKTLNYAVFGQAMWNVNDNLTATLGLRYTFEEKKRFGTQITTPTQVSDAGPFGPDFVGATALDEERDVENVSPSINIRYYPEDSRLMYYGSISKGFKSGGFNQQRTSSNAPTEFDDESSTNIELGWKGTFLDGQMQFNGAVYFIDYKDFQSQSFDGTDIAVRNAGTMESYGLELELQYVPTINWQLGGSIGYNKAEYKEFDNAECTVADARAQYDALLDQYDLALDPVGGRTPAKELISGSGIFAAFYAPFGLDNAIPTAPQGCSQDLEGQQVDNAPEWTASTYMQYEDVLSEESELMWFGRLEYIYTDSFFLAQDLDENIENDETNLINVRAGIKSMDQTWELAIWGRNITDEEYYLAGLDVPVYSGYAGFTAPPRTYGASLRYNF